MRDWIRDRLAWIDSQGFPEPKLEVVTDSRAVARKVSLSSDVGRIHYTTDGSDPRGRGGVPTTRASEYKMPVILPTNSVLVARVRSDFGLWSPPVRAGGIGPAKNSTTVMKRSSIP